MNTAVLFQAVPPIPAHALAAALAIPVGVAQFLMPKGTSLHRLVGYFWVALMVFVAASGFFIHEIRLWGLFSPIHLLSVMTLYFLWKSVAYARNGQIEKHLVMMVATYILALIITGGFTLLPGRVMHEVMFGG